MRKNTFKRASLNCIYFATLCLGGCLLSPENSGLAKGWDAWVSADRGWFASVAWGDSLFVAVGGSDITNKSILFTSPDGINWTKRFADTTQWLSSVTWTGNGFVAVGFSGLIFTSQNGIDWMPVKHPTKPGYGSYNDVVWTGGQIVVVGDGIILASKNGIDWSIKAGTDDYYLHSVTWTGNQLIAVGSMGQIFTSLDGDEWTQQKSGGVSADLNSVRWSGSFAIATGNYVDAEGNFLSSVVLKSFDGINWSKQENKYTVCCITSTDSVIIADRGKGSIMTSIDGVNWNAIKFGSSDFLISSSIWKDGVLYAVGSRHNSKNYYWPAVFTWRP